MRFFTTYDANSEANLDEILDALDDGGFDGFFAEKFYDDSGIKITVVFMCRDPRWNFRQRIRFSKKENKLYLDIMLDLDQMKNSETEAKKRIVAEKMINEIPQIIAKYKFKDFDLLRFSADLREWFASYGWIEEEFAVFD